jgi:hypothetical protein
MESKAEKKSWASEHVVALIGAVATIVAALISGFFLLASQTPPQVSTNSEPSQISTQPVAELVPTSQKEAEEVEKIKTESTFELASYKEVYDFAYSAMGMNLTLSAATAFADLWFTNCSEASFEPFKEAYRFAYSATGMNMTSSSAKEWAIGKTECLGR